MKEEKQDAELPSHSRQSNGGQRSVKLDDAPSDGGRDQPEVKADVRVKEEHRAPALVDAGYQSQDEEDDKVEEVDHIKKEEVEEEEEDGKEQEDEEEDEMNEDDDDDDDDDDEPAYKRRRAQMELLDFDFEKFCSVSLSNLNVYGCLVCGKYFQGRAPRSHAYTHSLEVDHHVYVNLQSEKVYCLPDGYEIQDPSLDDIRAVLNPKFTREQIAQLDKSKQWSRALDGSDYLPGMVGLNNIKENDYVNVIIQALMRVTPLRDFFLMPENYAASRSPLVQRFGELTRKIWHARNFKGQVSPHEFLQAVVMASKKRFKIGTQADPVEFATWLLNALHTDLGGTKEPHSSIIYKCFQGELEVVKEVQVKGSQLASTEGVVQGESDVDGQSQGQAHSQSGAKKGAMGKWGQVPLFSILKKFDGEQWTEVVRPQVARMRYRVTRLPRYLLLHMKRFTKNSFFVEKNPTLVNFPVKNLELKDYIPMPPPRAGVGRRLRSKYDLIANVVHDGKPGDGVFRVFVQRKSEELWYEMQDLHVAETLPQMVALSEAYMQIYEQQQ
eukprot:jgi/Mesen1/4096/ME000215S03378